MAMELLGAFPARASVTARLRRIIRGLKDLSPSTKRVPFPNLSDPAQESAAVAMAKLADQPVDGQLVRSNRVDQELQERAGVIHELTGFYEMNGGMTYVTGDVEAPPMGMGGGEEMFGINIESQEELDRMVKELFQIP